MAKGFSIVKNHSLLNIFFKALLLLFLISRFLSGSVEYKSKQNNMNITVTNPNKPLFGEITFDLEEEISIGDLENSLYTFSGPIFVDVDKGNNIYVLDTKRKSIRKYNPQGKYILETIRLANPVLHHVASNGDICVLDLDYQRGSKVIRFDSQAKAVETVLFGNLFISDFRPTRDHRWIVCINDATRNISEIALYGPDGRKIKSLASFPYKSAGLRISSELFKPRIIFCPIAENLFIYAHSLTYKIFYLNCYGEVLLTAEKREPAYIFSKEDRKRMIGEILSSSKSNQNHPLNENEVEALSSEIPKIKPFFIDVVADDRKNIYLLRIPRENKLEFDVFNASGVYTYKLVIPFKPLKIINESLYAIKPIHSTNSARIIRYRVKNYSKLFLE